MRIIRKVKRSLLLFLYGLDIGDTPGTATEVKKIEQHLFVPGRKVWWEGGKRMEA